MSHSIAPFPDHIDRDYFGAWLSGFTDGEGSFILRPDKGAFRARFSILLRRDDVEILKTIRSFWQCGVLVFGKGGSNDESRKNQKPNCSLKVESIGDIVKTVVPHFGKFPLQAKKARDFVIWKRGVEVVHRVSLRSRRGPNTRRGYRPTWHQADLDEFRELILALRAQRQYEATIKEPVKCKRDLSPGLFDNLDNGNDT